MREKETQTHYPKKFQSWGKNRSSSYVHSQINRGYSCNSNTQLQPQKLYNLMPHGGNFESASSYQHQPYHSQSLPRGSILLCPNFYTLPQTVGSSQMMPRRGVPAGSISSPTPTQSLKNCPSHSTKSLRGVRADGNNWADKRSHQLHFVSKYPPEASSRFPVLPTLNQDATDNTQSEEERLPPTVSLRGGEVVPDKRTKMD